MDFSLNEEQVMIIDTAKKIGETFGPEYWAEQDKNKTFPQECWSMICESGLASAALPAEVGGSGLGMVELALIVEELAAGGGGATLGQLFMINPIFGGVSISKFGSQAMKEQLLPKLNAGKINFCMSLTEPDAGTNTLAMKTFAEKQEDGGWILNGQKTWITAVDVASKMLLVARTQKPSEVKKSTEGISMFIIDVDRQGLSYTPIEKVGTQTLSACAVFFDNVYIRDDELIGTENNGFYELLEVLNTERIITTASLVGAGRLAKKLAIQYANERKIFGDKPISSYQGVQFPLAQSYAELQCARLMNLKAASLCDNNQPYGSEANMAKLIASQSAMAAIEHSMQTMGGMGYSKEYFVERLWRDARLFKFAPVSAEMILNFIATHELGMPKSY